MTVYCENVGPFQSMRCMAKKLAVEQDIYLADISAFAERPTGNFQRFPHPLPISGRFQNS